MYKRDAEAVFFVFHRPTKQQLVSIGCLKEGLIVKRFAS